MVTEQAIVATGFGLVLGAFAGYVGILLLRLRPPHPARTAIAVAFLLATLTSLANLGRISPSSLRPLFLSCIAVGAGLGWTATILFLALYPTPIRWKSAGGVAIAALLAYGVVSVLLDLLNNATDGSLDPLDEVIGFGVYTWIHQSILTIVLLTAVFRARKLAPPERVNAIRILAAIAAGTFLFAGYDIVQHTNSLLNGPLDDAHARYKLLSTRGGATLMDTVTTAITTAATIGIFVLFAIGNRERLAWVLAGVGAFAYVLDQFVRGNIIDLGIASLVTPAVILREATQRNALGVRRVPARLGLPVAIAAGLVLLILILALASLIAADQPLVMTLALLVGLVAGGILTYALRPRDITLTLTRVGGEAPRAQPPARIAPGEIVSGRYRLERLLGAGGQGDAWLAHDDVIGRTVVLKSVSPQGVREARMVGALNHPSVVQLYDVIEAPGVTFLVLEFVEGGDLRALLSRKQRLPPTQADAILSGILDALDAVHARSIVHGDLKPENVLLDGVGRPKLVDFGIARRQTPSANRTLAAGAGTLQYMSPEQARGEEPTPASDLYAAGLLYREMLTGGSAAPLGLDDVQLRAVLATRSEISAPPGPRGDLIRRALARDPTQRYHSAGEFREALRGVA